MKKNLSHRTIASMYRSLAAETWNYFDVPKMIPPFEVEAFDFVNGQPSSELAQTAFMRWDTHQPVRVVMNEFWVPYMYEDEVICILLHELAHCVVGWEQDHGPVWQKHAEEIGSVPAPSILLRAAWNEELPFVEPELYAAMHMHFTGPSLDVA